MNQKPILLSPTPLTDEQLAIIDLLNEALEQTRAGNITSIGIVACMKGGYASVMAGRQPGDLNLACDDLKWKIREATAGGRSSIVRAR